MKKNAVKIIRIISILVLIFSLVWLGVFYFKENREKLSIEAYRELKGASAEGSGEMLDEYKALYAENPDTVGWLRIEGTDIDYVVMQDKTEPEKYLHLDFFGSYSRRGCLFVGEGCDVAKSDNILIYGHHMKDGSMFGHLVDYQSKDFYKEHQYISFDTLYEKRTYQVVAAINTKIPPAEQDCFRYWECVGENDEEMFSQYLSFIDENKLYDTGTEIESGDKLLTLSTCAYHTKDGRFILVAKLVED